MRRWWIARRPKDARLSEAQRALRVPLRPPRHRHEYLRVARWWELEAARGYPSSAASTRYAGNMRWAAELVMLFGAGTWVELLRRSGHANPEATPKRSAERP